MASLGAEPLQREMGVVGRRGDGVVEYSAIDFRVMPGGRRVDLPARGRSRLSWKISPFADFNQHLHYDFHRRLNALVYPNNNWKDVGQIYDGGERTRANHSSRCTNSIVSPRV
jgi:hypothetical protein